MISGVTLTGIEFFKKTQSSVQGEPSYSEVLLWLLLSLFFYKSSFAKADILCSLDFPLGSRNP